MLGSASSGSVFLSHAGEQKYMALTLTKCLLERRQGLDVFLDQDSIQAGEGNWMQIETSLKEVDVVVLVLSKEFLSKPHPMAELYLAMKRLRESSGRQSGIIQLVPIVEGKEFTYEALEAEQERYAAEAKALCETSAKITKQQARFKNSFLDKQGLTLSQLFQQFSEDLKQVTKIGGIRNDLSHISRVCQEVVDTTMRCLARAGKRLPQPEMLPSPLVLDEASVDLVLEHLTCGHGQRAVMLTGMAGMGKSVCARQAFNILAHDFPHMLPCSVDLMNMGQLDDAAVVKLQQAILNQLGFTGLVRSVRQGCTELRERLQGQPVLLLLDNAVPSALDVLLRSCAAEPKRTFLSLLGEQSMVLVTSRAGELPGFGSYMRTEIKAMPDHLALKLLLQHVCDGSATEQNLQSMLPEHQDAFRIIIQQGGGCPLAIEALGKHLKSTDPASLQYTLEHGMEELLTAAMQQVDSNSCLAQLSQHLEDGQGCKQGYKKADVGDMLKDVAFFFGEHDHALQLLQWCFTKPGAKEALQELGLLSSGNTSNCLNPVLLNIIKAVVNNENQRMKVDVQVMVDQETCMMLKGLWVIGEEVCDEEALKGMQRHGRALRLLQLACGLQDQPLLKPAASTSLYLLAISAEGAADADAAVVPTPRGAVVDFTSPSRPKGARSMVLLHGRPKLTKLELHPCEHVSALWVSECPELRYIQLAQLSNRSRPAQLVNLCKVLIMGCPELRTVTVLGGQRVLEEVWLCGCSLPVVASQLAGRRVLCLVLQPCRHCKMGACLQSMQLCSLAGALVPCSIPLQCLSSLTRLELRVQQPQPQPPQQQHHHHHRQHCDQQVNVDNTQDQDSITSSGGGTHEVPRYRTVQAVAASTTAVPQPELPPLLSILTCLEVASAPSLPGSSSAHGLGHLLLQHDGLPATRWLGADKQSHCLKATDCPALNSLCICSTLATLQLAHCKQLTSLYVSVPADCTFSLRTMVVQDCPQLAALPDLGCFHTLTRLELNSCRKVGSIVLGSSLQELQLTSCSGLQHVAWSGKVCTSKPPESQPELQKLRLHDCPQLAFLPDLQHLPSLRLVDLQGCSALQQLALSTSLVRAYFSSCGTLTSLEAAAGGAAGQQAGAESLPEFRLQVLRVHDCCSLSRIGGIPRLAQLVELTVRSCAMLQHMELSSSVRRLTVKACPMLIGIQPLATAATGTELRAQQTAPGKEPWVIAGCRLCNLTTVMISECPQLQLHKEQLPHPQLCRCVIDDNEVEWEWGWYHQIAADQAPARSASDHCNNLPVGSNPAKPVATAEGAADDPVPMETG